MMRSVHTFDTFFSQLSLLLLSLMLFFIGTFSLSLRFICYFFFLVFICFCGLFYSTIEILFLVFTIKSTFKGKYILSSRLLVSFLFFFSFLFFIYLILFSNIVATANTGNKSNKKQLWFLCGDHWILTVFEFKNSIVFFFMLFLHFELTQKWNQKNKTKKTNK